MWVFAARFSILYALFLTSCGLFPQPEDGSAIDTKHFRIFDHSKKTGEQFIANIESYRNQLLPELQKCPYIEKERLSEAAAQSFTVSILTNSSFDGGATFRPPDWIMLSQEISQNYLSFFGHEYVRALLWWMQSDLWDSPSDGQNNGWHNPTLGCAWNMAETLSLGFK